MKEKNKYQVLRFAITERSAFKWEEGEGLPAQSSIAVYINEREKEGWGEGGETWQL
jgi:hypothetical protein